MNSTEDTPMGKHTTHDTFAKLSMPISSKRDLNHDLPVLVSLAQYESSSLANYATEMVQVTVVEWLRKPNTDACNHGPHVQKANVPHVRPEKESPSRSPSPRPGLRYQAHNSLESRGDEKVKTNI
uniref:Uncharacterized protein n=1 Tax=Timema cristinae TaxID=61476 RepID=A0A7R9CER1_TIMCR|nr:unnamed protein product [Timema cristinae]